MIQPTFEVLPFDMLVCISKNLDPTSYDWLRCASKECQRLVPLGYDTTRLVEILVAKMDQYGPWKRLETYFAYASLSNAIDESILHHVPHTLVDCLTLCTYRESGISLDDVKNRYSPAEWVARVYAFVFLCMARHATHKDHVIRLLDSCTPDTLRQTFYILWHR